MAERITVDAVRYTDEFGHDQVVALLRDGQRWMTADADGLSYWEDGASFRTFAHDWRNDPDFQAQDDTYRAALADTLATYDLLAAIADEAPDPAVPPSPPQAG